MGGGGLNRLVTPELDLTIACCRWPPSPGREEAVRNAWQTSDPDTFVKVIRRHRVEGLAHQALRHSQLALPAPVADALARDADRIAARNLVGAVECRRLLDAFESRQIALLFLKGLTLGELAYDTIVLKQAVDVDVLIAPDDYDSACAVLEELGYRCLIPGRVSRQQIADWAACAKDSVWRHAGNGVVLELHQRLVANPEFLAGLTVHSPRQLVQVAPAISLPTLATEELFTYLCAHGILSGWARLKWAADLGALLKDADEQTITHLFARACELDAQRPAAVALLLLQRLFGREIPESLRRTFERDRKIGFLLTRSLHSMVRGGPTRELHEQLFGTFSIHVSRFLVRPGLRHKVAELRQKLRQANIGENRFSRFQLLKPILILPLWLGRRRLRIARRRKPHGR